MPDATPQPLKRFVCPNCSHVYNEPANVIDAMRQCGKCSFFFNVKTSIPANQKNWDDPAVAAKLSAQKQPAGATTPAPQVQAQAAPQAQAQPDVTEALHVLEEAVSEVHTEPAPKPEGEHSADNGNPVDQPV